MLKINDGDNYNSIHASIVFLFLMKYKMKAPENILVEFFF